jgi:hypothetical protein
MIDEREGSTPAADGPAEEGGAGTGADGGGRPGEGSDRSDRSRRPVNPDRPCMNCGDPTPGEYCPSCGQRKVEVRVSVRTLIMDVLEDQFILDKRLPRTLGALLFKPGHLTVEHVNGRIVRYIHPFRLYLVTSLVFFLFLSLASIQLVRRAWDGEGAGIIRTEETGTAGIRDALAGVREELADTTRDRDDIQELREAEAELVLQLRNARIDSLAARTAQLDTALARVDATAADTAIPDPVRRAVLANREVLQRQLEVAAAQRDTLLSDTLLADLPGATGPTPGSQERTLAENFGWDEDPPTVSVAGIAAVDSALAGQVRRLGAMTPREALETTVGTFFNYVPTLMFILLPVFAVVLKLLYIRRGRYYAEHFVFLLHVHSVVFLLATVMLLVRSYAPGWIEALLVLWILVYIYLAMRRVYGQGRIKTFAKYWTLGWMYFWILLASMPFALVATLLLI